MLVGLRMYPQIDSNKGLLVVLCALRNSCRCLALYRELLALFYQIETALEDHP